MRAALLLSSLLLAGCSSTPLRWEPLEAGTDASLRGLSVVSDQVAWASGSGGTVLRTTDGGRSWTRCPPPGTAALDFRDVEAFDAATAVVLAAGIGEASRIFRTGDGGASWTEVYRPTDPEAFLNALAFWDSSAGLCIGDPDEDGFLLLLTEDGGRSWSPNRLAGAAEGEHCFAASGSCLIAVAPATAWLVTGGSRTRAWMGRDHGRSWRAQPIELPLASGTSSQGAFSAVAIPPSTLLVVGGDHQAPDGVARTAALVTGDDAVPAPDLRGYRSCVTRVGSGEHAWLLAVGPTGSEWTVWPPPGPWRRLDDTAYHVAAASPSGRTVWAAGPGGALARSEVRSPVSAAGSLRAADRRDRSGTPGGR